MNEYLEGDAKNIVYSLYRIIALIKQCKLENKTAKDIPPISEYGFVAQNFLLAIYESGQDKLAANKKQKYFRQCISTQFNKELSDNLNLKKRR